VIGTQSKLKRAPYLIEGFLREGVSNKSRFDLSAATWSLLFPLSFS